MFFTVRKRSCGKVMFLHLSLILFTGGEVYTPWVATAADGTHPTGMHSCSFGVDFCRNNYLNTIKEHRSPIFWSPCAFSCYIYDLYPSHIVRSYKNVLKSKELQLSLTIFALFNLISPTGFCT